jgi:hypothetical protein
MDKSQYSIIESQVSAREGSYQGLEEAALLTSLEDYNEIFRNLTDFSTYIELGSGHGLGPVLFAHTFPTKKAFGIEFEQARLNESLRLKSSYNLENVDFVFGDLLTCEIPFGDLYFLYFPVGPVLDRILKILGESRSDLSLVAIESHGDLLPRLDRENWLERYFEIPLRAARHYPNAVLYKKIHLKKPSFDDYSFVENFFEIQDEDGSIWLGDSYGMSWYKENLYNLQFPPRTINQDQILNILDEKNLTEFLKELISLRRKGPLSFETDRGILNGEIRKIFIRPDLKLELSTGQHLLFSEINSLKTL